jgi:membrane protease YdiL (CAAX protease family)
MELNSFHIDKFCLFLFILFGSLFRVRGIDNFVTLILEFFLFLFVVTLSIILIKAKIPIRSFPIFNKWNGFAIIFGFVFVAFVITFDPRIGFDSVKSISIMLLASSFLKNLYIEMGSSVIIEEPIFRGFLWGTLRKLSWPESIIFLLQAFLFWISHIYYLRHPFTFWIAAPILSLLLGYLALKTKSIIPPMITHVIYNAFLVAFVAMI